MCPSKITNSRINMSDDVSCSKSWIHRDNIGAGTGHPDDDTGCTIECGVKVSRSFDEIAAIHIWCGETRNVPRDDL